MKIFDSKKFRNFYKNILIQKIIIVSVLVMVFWHGLWDSTPRADQIPYLHHISQYHSLLDIIKNGFALNRVIGGDISLFRPILFIELGTFYHFFGYNFFLWQLSSLILHILVVLSIYSLLLQSKLNDTLFPLTLALVLGVAFTSSELVYWHHLGGYLLFCLLMAQSVIFLLSFLETNKAKYLWNTVILSCLSEFTYELGFIFNLMIALFFLYRFFITKYNQININYYDLKLGALFIGVALLYPICNIYHLWLMNYPIVFNTDISSPKHSFLLACSFAKEQILFWFKCLLYPTQINIEAGGRTVIRGIELSDNCKHLCSINQLAIKILGFSVILHLFLRRNVFISKNSFNLWGLLLLFAGYLFIYSFIIAWGRTIPRGIDYVLYSNIYYSYIPYAIAIIFVALMMRNYSKFLATYNPPQCYLKLINFLKTATLFGLIIIVCLNAIAVFNLGKSIRFEYSISRHEVIEKLKIWQKTRYSKPNEYYSIANCVGNDKLEWFEGLHIRKNSGWKPPFTLVDALWPEQSFNLNKNILKNSNYSVTEIRCRSKSKHVNNA